MFPYRETPNSTITTTNTIRMALGQKKGKKLITINPWNLGGTDLTKCNHQKLEEEVLYGIRPSVADSIF